MSVSEKQDFIRNTIRSELADGKLNRIVTRFPPEPNGYLHIGHAKSILLNFGIAQAFEGSCPLRFDDTNPEKETQQYVDAIIKDLHWLLGRDDIEIRYTSDYFEQLYQFAISLIEKGEAYVDSLSPEQIRQYRGTLTQAGQASPYRCRSVEENIELFAAMRAGKFAEGQHVLRAKIDMSSGNINMRDPTLYRVKHAHHARTGEQWCIYPMYDFAHPISDAIDGVTHSLCTLEFQDHRPLYEWLVQRFKETDTEFPKQIEFSRLNLSYTITSKRKLQALVDKGIVNGWDDPLMPTLSGMRARGYRPQAIAAFCDEVGISKSDSVIDMSLLEEAVRDDWNQYGERRFAVLDPLKVVITNLDGDACEWLDAPKHPQDETLGKRQLPFTRELWIEREDFLEQAPKKFFRLSLDKEVRLRYGYVIHCHKAVKDEQGKIIELHCTYDVDTLGKNPQDRKVKGVIHWLSAAHALKCEVTLLDRLLLQASPEAGDDLDRLINPDRCQVITESYAEPHLQQDKLGEVFQFERLGYFKLSQQQPLALQRVMTLKDSWQSTKTS